jgi:alkylhydroperoxidase/carboxymuconolactone decarboxylase family protein YurZ
MSAQEEKAELPVAWVALPDSADVEARMAADHPYNVGPAMAMSRLSRAHPRIGKAFSGLFAEIMFQPGVLERRQREMVAAVAAAAQDCEY